MRFSGRMEIDVEVEAEAEAEASWMDGSHYVLIFHTLVRKLLRQAQLWFHFEFQLSNEPPASVSNGRQNLQ